MVLRMCLANTSENKERKKKNGSPKKYMLA
jgi:hypothetical protein